MASRRRYDGRSESSQPDSVISLAVQVLFVRWHTIKFQACIFNCLIFVIKRSKQAQGLSEKLMV